jgi:hypothetical protein
MVLQVFGGLVPELGLRETSDKERAAQLIVEVAADGADVDAASLRSSRRVDPRRKCSGSLNDKGG